MKAIIFSLNLVLGLFLIGNIHAQGYQAGKQGFNFQGYAIGPDGQALANKNIDVKCTLIKGSTTEFTESHVVTSDMFGVFNVVIGSVNYGTFRDLNFSGQINNTTDYFVLKVEVKEVNEPNYAVVNNEPLSAVPYAREAANGVPVGTIVAFGGDLSNIPAGWLYCDGRQVSKVDYRSLYLVLQSTWGSAQTATFKLPDLRAMVLKGAEGNGVISVSTVALGAHQADGVGTHGHTASSANAGAHSHGGNTGNSGGHYHQELGGNPYPLDGSGSYGGSTSGIGATALTGYHVAVNTTHKNQAYKMNTSTDGIHMHTITPEAAHKHDITVNNNTGTAYNLVDTKGVHYIIKY